MKRLLGLSLFVFTMFLGTSALMAQGQGANHASVLVPDSTVEHPEDVGVRAHTNHLILLRENQPSPAASSPSGKSPLQIRNAYNLPLSNTGGLGVIAIVDAYDYPTAQSDFDTFSTQFGLPLSTAKVCNGANPCFKKVLASSGKTRTNCGWGQEAALDIEWAHAMAPFAQIVLVEAKSNSFSDLFAAIDVATNEVKCSAATCSGGSGEGDVSMSWGGSEFSGETSDDSHFNNTANIVYFASSGDTGGKTIYPSVSPFVVAAGGTTLNMSGNTFISETGWSGSGGGPSTYEGRPSFQDGIVTIVGSQRGVPDFSFDADPNTGVSVFDSTTCQGLSGWLVFGGTSVASPSLSGIVNSAGHFYTSSNELSTIYANLGNSSDFRDITSGSAGSFFAGPGWDFVTGVGSNLGLNGK